MNTAKQIQVMVGLVFLLIAGLLAYTMWEPTRAENSEEDQLDQSLEYGAKLFGNNCAICHGLNGEGFVGPPLNVPALRPADAAELAKLQDRFTNTIACGRVGTFMPAWSQAQGGSLNNDQIRQLVTLITRGDEKAWEEAKAQAEESHVQPTRPSPDQVNQGACGQVYKAPATPEGPPPSPQAAWNISMKDNSFTPNRITVAAGQEATITAKNDGQAVHNLRIAGPDGKYDTTDDAVTSPESIRTGQSGTVKFTFTAAGTLNFRCDFHPVDMVGTLTVQ